LEAVLYGEGLGSSGTDAVLERDGNRTALRAVTEFREKGVSVGRRNAVERSLSQQ
jgi:hypothetical protein